MEPSAQRQRQTRFYSLWRNDPRHRQPANDLMALRVFAAARKCGRDLPDQHLIAGFDNSPMVRFVRPALTSVSQNVLQMEELAATQLIEAIDSKEKLANRGIELPYMVRLRESLARLT